MATGEEVTVWTGSETRYGWQLMMPEQGGNVRLDRINSGRAPVVDSHHTYSAENVLGIIEAGSVKVTAAGLVGRIRFKADKDLPERIRTGLQQGVIQNLSIQAIPYAQRSAGREGVPPARIMEIWDWEPIELSVVAAGRDSGAYMRERIRQMFGPFMIADGGGGGGGSPERPPAAPSAAPNQGAILETERGRIAGIASICQAAGLDPAPHYASGATVEAVRAAIAARPAGGGLRLEPAGDPEPVDQAATIKQAQTDALEILTICQSPLARNAQTGDQPDPAEFIKQGLTPAAVREKLWVDADGIARGGGEDQPLRQANQSHDQSAHARLVRSISNALVERGDPRRIITAHEKPKGGALTTDHSGISLKEAGRLLLMESGLMPRAAVAQMYGERQIVDAIMQHGVHVRQSFLGAGILRVGQLEGEEILGAQAVAQAVGGVTGDLLGAQGGADLSVVVENVMHRMLNAAYSGAAETFTYEGWTDMIMSPDFRPVQHVMMGATPNLSERIETGDFRRAHVPNPEKATTQVSELGTVIVVDRITIVNDDLGVLMRNTQNNAIAARRTQDDASYDLLNENTGHGPTINVTGASGFVFKTASNNLGAATALTSENLNTDAVALEKQKAHSQDGQAYGGYKFDTLLCNLEQRAKARIIRDAEKDPGTDNQNVMQGQYERIISSPRLSGTTRRYLFSMGLMGGVMATPFCRSYYGSTMPYLAMAESFTTRGGVWIVALDFGVQAITNRGAHFNPGA